MKNFFLFASITLIIAACNLTQEVELDLPDTEERPVVECYLEPGEPYRLLLTRSAGYFDEFPTEPEEFVNDVLLEDAQVFIFQEDPETGRELRIILENEVNIDLRYGKLYNYSSPEIVPGDTSYTYRLSIQLPNGERIGAQTRILPAVPIDSIVIEYPEDQELIEEDSLPKARVLTYLTDDPSQTNFYRRMYHWNSLDSIPEQDFVTRDDFVDNGTIVFGTGYDYEEGTIIYNTIFHISEEYYNYQNSIFASIAANENPFAPPGLIESNVSGSANPIGIFTGLTYVQEVDVVPPF